MSRARVVRGCAGALVLGCSGALLNGQQPVFRTSADLVTVPVSVRANGTPVGGLKPADFVVLDNGVPQKVQSLEGEAVPADITLVVESGYAMRNYIGTVSDQVAKISKMVRPLDRLEVISIDTYVEQLLPLKPAAEQPALGRLTVGRFTSSNDAMVAALLREPDRERPHLIIVIGDTIDQISATDLSTVRDIARQSGAIFVVAWITMAVDDTGSWYTSQEREDAYIASPSVATRSVPRAQYWEPHHTPRTGRKLDAFDALKEATEMTGGAMHPPGVFIDRSAAAIFNKLFDDYRHSYILRYTAEGVARDGWHEITVTTPKYPSYELHARKGYLAETPKPPVDLSKLAPGSLAALLQAEEESDAAAVNASIRENSSNAALLKLLVDFKAGGNAFPSSPRKEFVLALELAETALPVSFPAVRAAGYDLLTRYGRLVRQVSGDDEFEKDWLKAQIGLAEAPVRPAEAQKFVDAALKRYPAEPRFVLARAITAEEAASAKDAAKVLAAYDLAAADPATRDEALIRKARLLTVLGSPSDALRILDKTGPIADDAMLRFWRELVRAKTLDGMGRWDETIAAYRAALTIAPEAQSARVGLMNTLARTGRGADARAVAEAIQTASANADDPWWGYWQADYRFFADLVKKLRGLAK
jgi:VWFA-related protein